MKKIAVFVLTFWFGMQPLWAQEEEPKTLFGDQFSLSHIGIMLDPGLQWTEIAGQNAGMFFFRGGLVFNDRLTVGGFYGQLINDIRPASFENNLPQRAHLDSYQAGGFIEYTLFSSKLVHLTFPVSVGLMELEVDGEGRNWDYEETKTLFVEPRAHVEVNLHRFCLLYTSDAADE